MSRKKKKRRRSFLSLAAAGSNGFSGGGCRLLFGLKKIKNAQGRRARVGGKMKATGRGVCLRGRGWRSLSRRRRVRETDFSRASLPLGAQPLVSRRSCRESRDAAVNRVCLPGTHSITEQEVTGSEPPPPPPPRWKN